MRRSLRGFVLSVVTCAAVSAMAQAGYGGGQAANPTGYGGNPTMMAVQTVAAPDFHGMTLAEAQAANVIVPANGAQPNTAQRPIFSTLNTTEPKDGVVDSQTPTAGTKVYPGREAATLTMKAAQISVPALAGMTVAEARSRLTQSSLVLGQVSGDATLKIASQAPAAGVSVAPLTVVNVVMAVPDEPPPPPPVVEVTVPNVKTLSESAAAARLAAARLGKPIFLGPANGVVVKQTPEAGSMVADGSRVRLVMVTPNHTILVVPQKSNPWGWYAAGGVVLLGAIGAFVAARKPPNPPAPVPAVAATMVAKPNASSAKVKMTSDPALRWSVQLRDKPAVGVTTVKGEIEGKR